jgi:hypothetical protein
MKYEFRTIVYNFFEETDGGNTDRKITELLNDGWKLFSTSAMQDTLVVSLVKETEDET